MVKRGRSASSTRRTWEIELLSQILHANLRGGKICRHHFSHTRVSEHAPFTRNTSDVGHYFGKLLVGGLLTYRQRINDI